MQIEGEEERKRTEGIFFLLRVKLKSGIILSGILNASFSV